MKTNTKVFEVQIERPVQGKIGQFQTEHEFYVADHITKVIDRLKLEFADQSSRVVGIREAAPILAVLD